MFKVGIYSKNRNLLAVGVRIVRNRILSIFEFFRCPFFKSQVNEMLYLGRCSKRYHHRPRTMKKLGEFRPQEKGF